jgi:HK97 gp10 family phage protein
MSIEFKKFGDFAVEVDAGTLKAINEVALKIVAEAKQLAPVGKYEEGTGRVGGRLRNSIMWRVENTKGGLNDSGGAKSEHEVSENTGKMQGLVGLNLDYGIYQEYGTRRMPPQPYLRPAIALAEGQAVEDVKAAIEKEHEMGKFKIQTRKFEEEMR